MRPAVGGQGWLERLPALVADLARRWELALEPPFEDASAGWVARCRRGGEALVLKVGWPHYEARDEIDGLLFWAGGPVVEVREYDRHDNAMLLERCDPGTTLRTEPESEQDVVVAELLRSLWRPPSDEVPFRPLREMIDAWSAESRAAAQEWPDGALAERGFATYQALLDESREAYVLATDLHAGNVLRSSRESSPWLVIDPKPYVGDPAYDATQHLMNCRERLEASPAATIDRISSLLEVDPTRVARWMFARLATESGDRAGKQQLALSLERVGFGSVR